MNTTTGKWYTILVSPERASVIAALFIGGSVPFKVEPRPGMPKHSSVAVSVDEGRTETLKEAAKLSQERVDREGQRIRREERNAARRWEEQHKGAGHV